MTTDDRVRVQVRIPPVLFTRLERAARQAGVTPGQAAGVLLTDCISAQLLEPDDE